MAKMPASGGSYIRDAKGDLTCVEEPTKPSSGLGPIAKSADAEDVIAALQARLHAGTDQALAEALSVGRSTIANWRRRGRVPQRYMALVEEDAQRRLAAAFTFDLLSSEERAALTLAIMRMQRGYLAEISSYPEFLRRGGFIPVQITEHVSQALLDLLAEMENKNYDDPYQCLNEMVFNELFST